MGKRRVNTLGHSDIFKSALHGRMGAGEVRTIAEAGNDSATKDALSAVEQSGLFPSERPSSVGVRVATWAAIILAGFLLMILAAIGTAAILVDRECEAAYGRNNCE